MWAGLTIAYAAPRIPPSFAILAVATGCYLGAFAITRRGALAGPGRRAPAGSDDVRGERVNPLG